MITIDCVLDHIISILPDAASAEIKDVIKNNGVKQKAIGIYKNFGNAANGFSFYVEDIINQKGFSDADKYRLITKTVNQALAQIDEIKILSDAIDRDMILSTVEYQVVNRQMNLHTEFTCPSKPVFDLSVRYKMHIQMPDKSIGKITINNMMLERYKITEEELDLAAKRNLQNTVFEIYNVGSAGPEKIIYTIKGQFMEKKTMPSDALMYAGTTKNFQEGAHCILYAPLLSVLTTELKAKSLIIIPSSIHEVIFMPQEQNGTMVLSAENNTFCDTIRTVNSEHLAPSEILSEHIYVYDLQSNRISWRESDGTLKTEDRSVNDVVCHTSLPL